MIHHAYSCIHDKSYFLILSKKLSKKCWKMKYYQFVLLSCVSNYFLTKMKWTPNYFMKLIVFWKFSNFDGYCKCNMLEKWKYFCIRKLSVLNINVPFFAFSWIKLLLFNSMLSLLIIIYYYLLLTVKNRTRNRNKIYFAPIKKTDYLYHNLNFVGSTGSDICFL